MNGMRHLAAAFVLAAAAAACTAGPSAEPPPGGVVASAEDAIAVLDEVEGAVVDGHVPVDAALRAFTLAFGPLPGVETPERGDDPITSGTGPLRWVLSNWESLSPEQQAAVESYLAPPQSEAGGRLMLAGMAPVAPVAAVDDLALLNLVEEVKEEIAAKLSRPLTVDIELVVAPNANSDGGWLWTQAQSPTGPLNGDMTLCRITIGEPGMPYAEKVGAGEAGADFISLLAHEIFHCFDFDLSTIEASLKRPPWVVEGLAQWVGLTVAGGDVIDPAGNWGGWFIREDASLFIRTYSAVGFFAHLEETGTDVWSGIDPILLAGDSGNDPAYAAATTATGPTFLNTWASSLVRDSSRAPDWDTAGPGLSDEFRTTPADYGPLDESGAVHLVIAAPHTASLGTTDLQAEVAVLEGLGPGMVVLGDGAALDLPAVHGAVLCTKEEGCTCPEDSPGAVAIFRLVPKGPMTVAVTGGPAGNDETVTGYTLADFCQRGMEECTVGTWFSLRWEVPYIDTADGAGTITMTVEQSGDIEVSYDPAFPLYATYGPGPRVRMDFAGTYSFNFFVAGAQQIEGNASVTSWADLDGEWFQVSKPIELVPGGIGYVGNSQLVCEGDDLVVKTQGGEILFGR